MRIHLVRHGITTLHGGGRYVGSTDAPLNAEGRHQAESLRPLLAHLAPKHVLCSPLARCRQTAELAQDGDLEIIQDLREVDFGDWEGLTFAEIADGWPRLVEKWNEGDEGFAFPGGEALDAFGERMGHAAARIRACGQDVVVFCHGGVVRALLCRFLNLPAEAHIAFSVVPASVATVRLLPNAEYAVLECFGISEDTKGK